MPTTINEFISSMSKAKGFARLSKFEVEDNTRSSQEYSCTSDKGCEIVDLVKE